MRRAKSISVRVKAPTRGLVVRLPSEFPDAMPSQGGVVPGTTQRASSRASNVRYEDGVVCNAPGYERVKLDSTVLSGLVAQWNLNEVSGSRLDSSGNGHTLSESGTVSSGDGVFGLAAVFSTPPFIPNEQDKLAIDVSLGAGSFISPYDHRVRDSMTVDSSFTEGFYNPVIQQLHDSSKVDVSLDSGTYLATVTVEDVSDSALMDSTILSGTYTLTVLVDDSQQDLINLDSTMNSGAYTVSVLPEAVEDKLISDSSLDSGATNRIADPESVTDRLSLTASLDSGSYS